MKKLLLSGLIAAAAVVVIPSAAEAKSTSTAVEAAPQIIVQTGRNRRFRNRRVRVTTTTRIVGYGRNRYRETIRTTIYPNGRRVVRVISRQRVRW